MLNCPRLLYKIKTMKTLLTIATVTLISVTAQAGSWGFTLGNGAGFYYGNQNNQNNCRGSYYQPRNQVYYPSQNVYMTPAVYVKTNLYQPPVIMQRAVINSPYGYSSQQIISRPHCGGYRNRW